MLSTISFQMVTVCLSFLAGLVVSQETQWIYDIPPEEAAALASIVEDDPGDVISIQAKDWLSPEYALIYKVPLPIPPIKQPTKFINNAAIANSVHLHGSYSRAAFDGWAEDVTQPGEFKDYYYPNQQSARLLWYHDHAVHETAKNAYFGQAGAYILTDPADDALNLPSGYGKYDIPLILSAKQYNDDGTLKTTDGETDSLWGDIIHVNGQPWPFLNVEPRKYRFRFLNAAVSRSFALYFALSSNVNGKLPFKVIASDAGLLGSPVQVSDMYISMAERYEIVFDFSAYAGQAVELRNLPKAGGVGVDDDYLNTDKVMRFMVSSTPVTDTSSVPDTLRSVPFPTSTTPNVIDHHFRFHRSNGEWQINNVVFADVDHRVLAKVPRGTTEIWELENSSGGWSHPIHVHLVDFRVLARTDGNRAVMPYEAAGLKDVVWLGTGETVIVEAHYAPWDGLYMFHCHNLIHEDHDMMAAFNVTALTNWGYNDTTLFLDPMEPKFRAKPFGAGDFQARTGLFSDEAIEAAVKELAEEDPYSHVQDVNDALDNYWKGQAASAPSAAKREVDGETRPIARRIRFQA
ncbi:hypothetical protein KVR01_012954 [Diaporthe batatas]|uniref:uncharacterized protein n=1 Tax=Diaporthe batatas TaxID=748121 RepID=UPI001D057E8D|nr:uncharacterized protein KVR01_012954 [Diaporthe batatas]KAG8157246.1 hypothetical protein KVR01_012954 [Diaporthe batatas]